MLAVEDRVDALVPDARPDSGLTRPALAGLALASGVAVGLATVTGWGSPAWWAAPAVALLVALTQSAVVSVPLRRVGLEFSFTDAGLALTFWLAPGAWLLLPVVAGGVVSRVLSRQGVAQGVRDAAGHAPGVAAGALAATLAGHAGLPGLSAAALAMSTLWLVRSAVEPLLDPRRLAGPRRFTANLSLSLVNTAGSASVGLLAAGLVLRAPAGLPGLCIPLVLLWFSFAQTTRRSAEARLFAELARGQERAGGSLDGSAEVVLIAAAQLLSAARVELLVFGADGLVRYSCEAPGQTRHELVGVEALDAAWVPDVLTGGVVHERHQGVPRCGVRVGPAGHPLALLHAVRPAGAPGFDREAVRTVELLAAQAETWLTVADLASVPRAHGGRPDRAAGRSSAGQDLAGRPDLADLADLAADTGPALTLLQESAARLARLTRSAPAIAAGGRSGGGTGGAGAVTDIVDELHTVERAVASLLGAIALASAGGRSPSAPADQPRPAPGAAAPGSPRRGPVAAGTDQPSSAQEWTSSGVLP